MSSKHRYLTKNVILFSLNTFIPKLLSILLIPLYTSCLTPAEYGVSDLITTTVSLLLPIFTLDIQDAVMRFAMDKAYDKGDVFSIAFRIVMLGTGIVSVGAFIFALLNIKGVETNYLIFFVLMFFTTSLYNSISLFCRGIDKVNVMVVGGVIQSVITLSSNILFLLVFEWGLVGYLCANTIGSVIALVWYFIGAKLHKYIKIKVNKETFKEMVSFSFPLIFSVIAWWVNNASDRYILTWLAGVATSGLYAISYKIPNILSIFQNVFTQAWSISAIKEFDKNDSDGFISNMYNMMNFSMIVVCSLILIVNIPVSKFLYAKEFFKAWQFVPPLLISVVFNAMALFIGSIFTAVKDTKTLSISTIVGAVVNTICNFIFIYLWGAFGAALATLLGYAVVFIMRHIILRKHILMRLNWFRDVIVYCLLGVQMVISYLGVWYIWAQVLVLGFIAVLYCKELKSALEWIKRRFLCKK